MYNPQMGIWMHRDPVGEGTNQYQYGRSDPIDNADPSGLFNQDVHEDATYLLALAAGACPKTANDMAASDQRQDSFFYAADKIRGLRPFEWYEQTLVDIWHLPGAGWDLPGAGLGVGSTVEPGSNQSDAILRKLREAAFNGGSVTLDLDGYSRARIPGVHLQIGWTETEAGSYFMSTRWGVPFLSNTTTIDIKVYNNVYMMGVYLHALQDSHGHIHGDLGHANIRATGSTIVNNITDLADRNQRSLQAAKDTYNAVKDFLKLEKNRQYGRTGGPRIDWERIEPLVSSFLSIRSIPSNSSREEQSAARLAKTLAYNTILTAIKDSDRSLPKTLKDYSKYIPIEIHYLGQLGDSIARQLQQPQSP